MVDARRILDVLDRCAGDFYFPMLDNGYVYLAASRLALYRSGPDWAMAIEIFGFSPRSGAPDVGVWTYASRLHARDTPEKYLNAAAYARYLEGHPNHDTRYFFPCEGEWQDPDDIELVNSAADHVVVRDETVPLPARDAYAALGIELASPDEIRVFEMCRWLAATRRETVLASEEERRCSVSPEMPRLLSLDDWHHPDLANGERPSDAESFRQMAAVLATGNLGLYRPELPPNNHWRNWPDGGTL